MIVALDLPDATLRACWRHFPFASKRAAQHEMKRHASMVKRWMDCRKCASGEQPNVFRCDVGGKHFHWGHDW